MIMTWGKNGKKFGFIREPLVRKLVDQHKDYRNLHNAYKYKYETYKEFGVRVPPMLEAFVNAKRKIN